MPDLTVDPISGGKTNTPPEGDNDQQKSSTNVTITRDEFDRLQQRLDVFERQGMGGSFGHQPPPEPKEPQFHEEIRKIDSEISELNEQIDKAIDERSPVSKLLAKRDDLNAQKLRIKIRSEDFEPAFSEGLQTLDQLSDKITRGEMPYYDLVKDDFESALKNLPTNQRMNPAFRKAAYNMAVGNNIDKITKAKQEEMLRSAAQDTSLTPGGKTGRSADVSDSKAPKPADVLGKDTMRALKLEGLSADAFYRKRGYEGWEDFWEKTGKDYFGDYSEED